MLVLLPEFIKKKMTNSMDKQIAYTDKLDNSLSPQKFSYCSGLVKLAEFEVATEQKEEKKTHSIARLTVLLDDPTNY